MPKLAWWLACNPSNVENPIGAVDFSVGFGDAISFGGTDLVRGWMGTNGAVDKCSSAYGYGELSGMAAGLAN